MNDNSFLQLTLLQMIHFMRALRIMKAKSPPIQSSISSMALIYDEGTLRGRHYCEVFNAKPVAVAYYRGGRAVLYDKPPLATDEDKGMG